MTTAGIGLPSIEHQFNSNPAMPGAIGRLCGFSGRLMTPMAVNFNIAPAALLELQDANGAINAQWPTALLLLTGNTILSYLLVLRI